MGTRTQSIEIILSLTKDPLALVHIPPLFTATPQITFEEARGS